MNNKRKSTDISLVINAKKVHLDPKTDSSLLAFLRSELRLTGSKQGCATGNCGACNVLIDGRCVQSCQINLTSLEHSNIETIENIVQTPLGARISKALIKRDAAQCGYCLPGIVVAAYAELSSEQTPDPVQALQRNLCRCGTHSRILNALQDIMTTQSNSKG